MNLAQKFLKRKIRKYKLYCRKHYMRNGAFPSEQLCTKCKYEYIDANGNHGCRLMYVMQQLQNKVPADWNDATINQIFSELTVR